MSRILKISESDYKVKVKSGGTITLDTGVENGETIITGNLTVNGVTTTISTANLLIEDNIILLNKNEVGVGITNPSKTSGVEIERGTLVNSQVLFDENISWYDYATASSTAGTWIFYGGELTKKTSGIRVNSIANDGLQDLAFDLNNTTTALRITRSPNYESWVTDDDHIPNRKWITDYIDSGHVVVGMADVDRLYKSDPDDPTHPYSIIQAFGTNQLDGTLQVSIGGNLICTFSGGGLTFKNNINIAENTLTNISASNLLITAANGNVELSAIVNYTDRTDIVPSAATVTVGKTKLFSSATVGAGKTNLYYTTRRAGEDVKDELVSKNRSLLFSMLF